MNSNEINNAFSQEAGQCHAWLVQRLSAVGGVTAVTLADRLVQRVLELGRLPYAQLALEGRLAARMVVGMGAASLQTGSGKVLLGLGQWGYGVLQFLLHWAYCLVPLLWVHPSAATRGPVTLVTGIGEESLFGDGDDAEFAAYCRNGPIAPLRDATQLYIQTASPGRVSTDPRIRYLRRPLIELIRCARLGLLGRLRALAGHVLAVPRFLGAAVRRPELALLGRDFAYLAPAVAVDRAAGMAAVVLTCSSVTEQPLWGRGLRHARVHMVWYAQNWKPVVFKEDGVASDIPFLHWMRADVHWVWTKAFGDYLRALSGNTEFYAAGPIVWRMPSLAQEASGSLDVVVFDVSPYSDSMAMSYCESPNYNSLENLTLFLSDIMALRRTWEAQCGQKLNVRVKTKRGYKPAYSRAYFDRLEQLDAAGELRLEPHATNIYTLIGAARVVIAYPFTSPPYIADAMAVPAIYYDPTGSIITQTFLGPQSQIRFAAGRRELWSLLSDILKPASGT